MARRVSLSIGSGVLLNQRFASATSFHYGESVAVSDMVVRSCTELGLS